MAPTLLRLRPKNQLTLPNNVLDKLGVKPGDFLEVVSGPGETIQLVPARLVREGTKEAEEVHRRAQEDFAAGRYHTFNSVEDVMRALDEPAAPSAQPVPVAVGDSRRVIEEDVQQLMGNFENLLIKIIEMKLPGLPGEPAEAPATAGVARPRSRQSSKAVSKQEIETS